MQSGDSRAIESLYITYFDRLYNLVFHSVKRNQAAAEDIVQNVFVSAMKSAKGFKGQSKLYTWLVGIAHHKIADYYKGQKKEAYSYGSPMDESRMGLLSIAGNSQSPVDELESAELRFVVLEALSILPLDYRQVLLLRYVEEMPVVEIGQVLNRSPKAIDGLLSRARKLLKENISRNA